MAQTDRQSKQNRSAIRPSRETRECQQAAAQLYQQFITALGYAAPANYAELLTIVEDTGAKVVWCADAPCGFTGVQIGDLLYVNASSLFSEHQRLRILAHEWCHWLRRRSLSQPSQVRLYQGKDGRTADAVTGRDCEEKIAREFERLF